ncbi:MAG: ankyrin repeat domain-containing protein [Candidatus Babeliales bacterium]|jgi:ankyrin repeat protein
MQTNTLYGMSSPVDGLEAPASFGRAVEVLWWRAVKGNHLTAIRTLLFFGVDPLAMQDSIGFNTFERAAYDGNIDIVRLFIDIYGNSDQKSFLSYRYGDGKSALSWAASQGHVDIVQLLIDADVDLNSQDNNGNTALMVAIIGGHYNIAQLLINAHAGLRAKNHYGSTALMIATGPDGNADIARQIITHSNIDMINTRDSYGNTVLMRAAVWGYVDIVRLLVQVGADTEIENNRGQNVRHIIEDNSTPHLRDILLHALDPHQFSLNLDSKCGICCEEDGGEFELLECGHYFHTGCIKNLFLLKKTNCPLCRENVYIPGIKNYGKPIFTLQASHGEEMKKAK